MFLFLAIQVARFLTQVASDELALTGYNFFAVTRTFMLTVSRPFLYSRPFRYFINTSLNVYLFIVIIKVAGTIVTYEIVLIQFNNVANGTTPANVTHMPYCP